MQPNFTQNILDDIEQANISYDTFLYIHYLLNQFLSEHHFNECHIDTIVGNTGHENILNLDIYLQNANSNNCVKFNDEFLDILINDKILDFNDYKNILIHFIPSQ